MMEMNIEDSTTDPRGFGGTKDPDPILNEDGEEAASEEEQMMYDFLTVRARKMIFGPGKEKILTLLGTGESPAQVMGQAGAMIMKSLVDSSKQSGRDIDTGIVINAGAEVVDDLNELGKANNIFQYDSDKDEEQQVTDALMYGAKYYGDGQIANGEITPEFQAQAQAEVDRGLAEEGQPQKTPIAEGVGQAMQPKPGIVGSQVQSGNQAGAM
jgi:hypothetical protein